MNRWFVSFVVMFSLFIAVLTVVGVQAIYQNSASWLTNTCSSGSYCNNPGGLGKHYCSTGVKVDTCKTLCVSYCDSRGCSGSNWKSNCKKACTISNGCKK